MESTGSGGKVGYWSCSCLARKVFTSRSSYFEMSRLTFLFFFFFFAGDRSANVAVDDEGVTEDPTITLSNYARSRQCHALVMNQLSCKVTYWVSRSCPPGDRERILEIGSICLHCAASGSGIPRSRSTALPLCVCMRLRRRRLHGRRRGGLCWRHVCRSRLGRLGTYIGSALFIGHTLQWRSSGPWGSTIRGLMIVGCTRRNMAITMLLEDFVQSRQRVG